MKAPERHWLFWEDGRVKPRLLIVITGLDLVISRMWHETAGCKAAMTNLHQTAPEKSLAPIRERRGREV
jgi:hypothetical protein